MPQYDHLLLEAFSHLAQGNAEQSRANFQQSRANFQHGQANLQHGQANFQQAQANLRAVHLLQTIVDLQQSQRLVPQQPQHELQQPNQQLQLFQGLDGGDWGHSGTSQQQVLQQPQHELQQSEPNQQLLLFQGFDGGNWGQGNWGQGSIGGQVGGNNNQAISESQPHPNDFDINGFDFDAFFTNPGDVKTDTLTQHDVSDFAPAEHDGSHGTSTLDSARKPRETTSTSDSARKPGETGPRRRGKQGITGKQVDTGTGSD